MCNCVSPAYTNSCTKPKLNAIDGISTNGEDILKTLTRYKAITTLTGTNDLEIFTGTKYKIVGDTVYLNLNYQFSFVDVGHNSLIELTGLPVAALTDGRWVSGLTIETAVPVYSRGLIEVQGTTVILKTEAALVEGTNYQLTGQLFYKVLQNVPCVPCECFLKAKKFYTTGLLFQGGVILSNYLPWTELTLTTSTVNLGITSQDTFYSRFDDQILLSINMLVEYTGAQASNEISLGTLPIAANSSTDIYSTLAAYDITFPDVALHLQIRTVALGANNVLTVIVDGEPFILGDEIEIRGQIVYQAA